MGEFAPVEYTSAAEMIAAYKASHSRLIRAKPQPKRTWAPINIPPPPPALPCLTIAKPDSALAHRQRYSGQRVLAAVANAHGLRVGEIIGPRRWRYLMPARLHVVELLMKHRPDLSLISIGKVLHRNHTTVLHCWRKSNTHGLGKEQLLAAAENELSMLTEPACE